MRQAMAVSAERAQQIADRAAFGGLPPNAARPAICCARSALTAIACRIPALSTTKMARRGFRRRRWPFRTPISSSGWQHWVRADPAPADADGSRELAILECRR